MMGAPAAPASAPPTAPPSGGDPISQLTPQDRMAIAAAPQAMAALKKIMPPEIGALIDAAPAGAPP